MDNANSKGVAEDKMINKAFDDMLNIYLASKHRKKVEIITKAFYFAKQAHKGIKRRSGEPYIMHPIAVARIVCEEIGLGSTSICAALLHDVVEDTDYTIEDIENLFGVKIAQIVEGLTKISGGIFGDRASAQAENFKKLLLTMSNDIRVILIKIADRLHNMRTLGSMLASKQYKIAGETLYIYAPLAHRLGLNKIKTELENLSFKYEHPEDYAEIENKLKATSQERNKVFDEFTAPIRIELDKMGLKYKILARIKSIYSIWNKMQTKHVPFEEIYDLLAVRVIFEPHSLDEELNDCFDIYVSISKIYKPHPDRLRDWVSHPKANGYQALHVTLMGNNGQWIEVQIRSVRMDDVAEQGFAAHWKYKEGGGSEDEGELEKWLKTIKEILDDPQPDAIDFLDTIKLNLFASEIFVFTPKGEIKTLPQNATALDFAFSLHTDIGSHCIGAKVNHKLVPISHKLMSGDQVEILTSKSQRVQPQWELFATTARARSKITSILRKEKKTNKETGEILLTDFLTKENIATDPNIYTKLCQLHNAKDKDELLESIGDKTIILGETDKSLIKDKLTTNWKKYLSFSFGKDKSKTEYKEPEQKKEENRLNIKEVLKLTDETIQRNYILADCCHPIPGDETLGYMGENDQIIIHKRQCPVAMKLKTSYGNRIYATVWDTHRNLTFLVYIYLKGIDGVGVLNKVTEIISQQLNVNIKNLNIGTKDGIFEGEISLLVHDVNDVKVLCLNLKKIPNIKEVTRIEK
ncbi:MAG: RelA/SpoT family protein [Bacteroidaceae bacterium]|nr:RelA/SpoT family protein [Bacteroidaceae bacterium]